MRVIYATFIYKYTDKYMWQYNNTTTLVACSLVVCNKSYK